MVKEFFELIDRRAGETIKWQEWRRRDENRTNEIFDEVLLSISSDDLRIKFKARGEYHLDRKEFYHKQASTLREDRTEQAGLSMANYSSGPDPVDEMQRQARDHEHNAAKFFVMAEHLREGTYLLDAHKMAELELDKANA